MSLAIPTTLTVLLLATCATAQGTDRTAPSVSDDADRDRPVLVVEQPVAILLARPGAIYAVLSGVCASSDAGSAGRVEPLAMLAYGQVGALGVVEIALPEGDFARLPSANVVLQAAVLADGESLQISNSVSLHPSSSGEDTLGAPRFWGRSSGGEDTLGAPRFTGRSSGGEDTLGAPRFGRRSSGGEDTLGAPRFGRRSSGGEDTLGAPRFTGRSSGGDTIGAPRFYPRSSGGEDTLGAPRFGR